MPAKLDHLPKKKKHVSALTIQNQKYSQKTPPTKTHPQHIITHTHTPLPPYPPSKKLPSPHPPAHAHQQHLLLLARAAGSISTLDNSTAKVLAYQLPSSKAWHLVMADFFWTPGRGFRISLQEFLPKHLWECSTIVKIYTITNNK